MLHCLLEPAQPPPPHRRCLCEIYGTAVINRAACEHTSTLRSCFPSTLPTACSSSWDRSLPALPRHLYSTRKSLGDPAPPHSPCLTRAGTLSHLRCPAVPPGAMEGRVGKSSSSGPRRADEPWRHVPVRLCVSRAPGGHDKSICLAQGERFLWLRQGWPLELGFQQQGQNPPWAKEGHRGSFLPSCIQ